MVRGMRHARIEECERKQRADKRGRRAQSFPRPTHQGTPTICAFEFFSPALFFALLRPFSLLLLVILLSTQAAEQKNGHGVVLLCIVVCVCGEAHRGVGHG